MSFSTDIKRIRTGLMLSQTEFGKLLGVNYQTVTRWEKGTAKPGYKAQQSITSLCREKGINFDVTKSLEDEA